MNEELSNDTPEYFVDSFPREDFPRWVWAQRPATLPPTVWLSETTHRDGQQGGLPLTVERSCRIYDVLCEVTGQSGAIRQAEFFPYHKSDRDALIWALERYRSGAPIEPTTWIRGNRDDVQEIRNIGIRETGLLCSASDYHTFHKFKDGGRRRAAEKYLDAVEMVLDCGIRPRVHLEDTTRAPVEYVQWLIEAVLERATHFPVELGPRFRVCDTLGIGLPYDDVALPRSIPRWICTLQQLGLAPEAIEFHPHNDTWLVVANCLAAIREGCGVISGTSLGTGERTGNAPLEAIMVHLIGMGYWRDNTVNLKAINQLVELYEEMGVPLASKYPLFGRDAFLTRAGIHADGINKFWWMYAPFNAPLLLGRNLDVVLTKDSGQAGLLFLLKQRLGLDLSKNAPLVIGMNKWIEDQFASGRVSPIVWEELEPIAKTALSQSSSISLR